MQSRPAGPRRQARSEPTDGRRPGSRRRLRVIGVLTAVLLVLLGCSAPSGDAPAAGPAAAPAPGEPPRALFFGDSYTVGFGGDGYVQRTAELMGWTPVVNAQGGTGYLNPSATPGQTSYYGRLSEVLPADPDVVLVQGSTNDAGEPVAAVETAAAEFYRGLQAAVPTARVVVVGPLAPPGVDPQVIAEIRDALARASQSAGLPFVDPIAEGWLTPPEGYYFDTIHPNDAGYTEMAERLAAALRDAGL